MTPSGWLVVRDALTIGPWHCRHADETSHTRPPTDHDADHMLVRTIECVQGEVQVEAVCEPMFDYGRTPARWTMCSEDWSAAEATDGADDAAAHVRPADRDRGQPRARAPHAGRGRAALLCARWAHGLDGPRSSEEAYARVAATSHYWRDWLAAAGFPTTAGARTCSARR